MPIRHPRGLSHRHWVFEFGFQGTAGLELYARVSSAYQWHLKPQVWMRPLLEGVGIHISGDTNNEPEEEEHKEKLTKDTWVEQPDKVERKLYDCMNLGCKRRRGFK